MLETLHRRVCGSSRLLFPPAAPVDERVMTRTPHTAVLAALAGIGLMMMVLRRRRCKHLRMVATPMKILVLSYEFTYSPFSVRAGFKPAPLIAFSLNR